MHRIAKLIWGIVLVLAGDAAFAQSTGSIRGTVTDSTGALVPGAQVTLTETGTNLQRQSVTDALGTYRFVALPVGLYRVEVKSEGFQTVVREGIRLEVNENLVVDVSLKVGQVSEVVRVEGGAPLVESQTITVGQVINQFTVQQIPLNGRRFVDLMQLVPGSVVPPQNGFLTSPLRGQGSFGVVTAGNREDTVNFMINGINLNDGVQNQITFQPSINTVAEFKAANSTFSAEFGHTSGTVVNIATRSGTNEFHGEVYDFLRNDALDAKNFFDNPNRPIPPFKRNQFGVAAGGPFWIPNVYDGRNRTFWFFSYEGLRQRQQVTFNRQVPTQEQRASVTDPVAQKLLPLIPLPNVPGTNTFAGSGSAPVDIDQFTGDLSHQLTDKDRIHGYYAIQDDERREPAAPVSNATLPGFGDIRAATRQIFTFNETHVFSNTVVNEFRFGFNRLFITFEALNRDDPTQFGFVPISPFGLPAINIQDTGLVFGGFRNFPQGRGDTTFVWSDTLSWLNGKHDWRFGTEIRRFFNNNFNNDMGQFIFPNFAAFASGQPSQFQFNQGGTSSAIATGAFQFFAQDSYKLLPNLLIEMGIRYEINTTPSERFDRFVAFDAATGSLRRINSAGFDELYDTNHNVMPRIGFAWDPFKKGKTSIRAGYGIFFDQPVTNSVTGLTTNAPFTNNLIINNPPSFADPFQGTPAGGGPLAVNTINPNFRNSYTQNWNLNVQHEVIENLAVSVGYFGSKGTKLRFSRNLNQPVNGVLPFPTVTLVDGTTRPASVITEVASEGNSSYNALWISANKRMSHGLQFSASYQWSHSIDYNSRNTQGIVLQDSRNPRANRGPSDFDVRHRFLINYLYELPFKGQKGFLPARVVEGWSVSGITVFQTGNPVTIVLGGVSPLTNVAGTVRPNLVGNPDLPDRDPANYFNPLAFAAPLPGQFGNLGRNSAVVGPGFNNFDFSVTKVTTVTEQIKVEFRTEFFNIFNHPNFGQPGAVCTPSAVDFTVSSQPGNVFPAGTCLPNASFGTIQNAATGTIINPTTFGRIQNTRFPTGDSGSGRQIQFALKLKW